MSNNNNKINLSTINSLALAQCINFIDTLDDLAIEAKSYTSERKNLLKKIEAIKEKTDCTAEEIKEAEKKVVALQVSHKDINEKLNDSFSPIYNTVLISGLYAGYVEYLNNPSSNSFHDVVCDFLNELEIKTPDKGLDFVVTKLTRSLGARCGGIKAVLTNRKFTQVMSEKQFKKLFMSTFIDLLIEKNVLDIEKTALNIARKEAKKAEAEKTEEKEEEIA